MKYIIRILPVLLCTFLFTTCDSEDRYVEEIQHEINFILPTTRSTQTGMFEVGDDIGVFAVERTNESQVGSIVNPKYVNLQYRYNGTQFVPVGQKVQYSGKKYDFYVYSPYNSTYTNIGQLSHSVSANQNKDNWESSDLCTAINTTGIATGNVQLDFAHKFATVKIIVDNDVKAVDLLQVQTLGLLSFATNQAHPQ
ncbi:MAG: fimbrillin family protein, partial [Bacteroides graminisolvens]|nr:fimbrillin family protein [Bacteroides graminisolvens]